MEDVVLFKLEDIFAIYDGLTPPQKVMLFVPFIVGPLYYCWSSWQKWRNFREDMYYISQIKTLLATGGGLTLVYLALRWIALFTRGGFSKSSSSDAPAPSATVISWALAPMESISRFFSLLGNTAATLVASFVGLYVIKFVKSCYQMFGADGASPATSGGTAPTIQQTGVRPHILILNKGKGDLERDDSNAGEQGMPNTTAAMGGGRYSTLGECTCNNPILSRSGRRRQCPKCVTGGDTGGGSPGRQRRYSRSGQSGGGHHRSGRTHHRRSHRHRSSSGHGHGHGHGGGGSGGGRSHSHSDAMKPVFLYAASAEDSD